MTDAAVMIARYLAATGRRDAAITHLANRKSWYSPTALFEELDTLDAVEALGRLARDEKIAWYHVDAIAMPLARRRRFDLVRPLLERTHAEPDHGWPVRTGALAGLWQAPAVVEDSLLVRDWLLPQAGSYERCACARFLALVGDMAMARAIVDEMEPLLVASSEQRRIELLAWLAPAVAALGDPQAADAMTTEAQRIWDAIYDENLDGYGNPFADTIRLGQATTRHVPRLQADHGLPWEPPRPVQHVFITGGARYGRNRAQQEHWRHAVAYAIAASDVPSAFAAFADAQASDPELPRASIDRDLALQLAAAATALLDPQRQDGGVAVIGALAEAGQLASAQGLLPHVVTSYTSPNVYARLAAHTRDRTAQRPWLDLALTGTGEELDLAQFVDADLRARR